MGKIFELLLDKTEDASAQKVINELEHIDDETDKAGIPLIRSTSKAIAESYGITNLPALVYFEEGIPNIYSGTYLS